MAGAVEDFAVVDQSYEPPPLADGQTATGENDGAAVVADPLDGEEAEQMASPDASKRNFHLPVVQPGELRARKPVAKAAAAAAVRAKPVDVSKHWSSRVNAHVQRARAHPLVQRYAPASLTRAVDRWTSPTSMETPEFHRYPQWYERVCTAWLFVRARCIMLSAFAVGAAALFTLLFWFTGAYTTAVFAHGLTHERLLALYDGNETRAAGAEHFAAHNGHGLLVPDALFEAQQDILLRARALTYCTSARACVPTAAQIEYWHWEPQPAPQLLLDGEKPWPADQRTFGHCARGFFCTLDVARVRDGDDAAGKAPATTPVPALARVGALACPGRCQCLCGAQHLGWRTHVVFFARNGDMADLNNLLVLVPDASWHVDVQASDQHGATTSDVVMHDKRSGAKQRHAVPDSMDVTGYVMEGEHDAQRRSVKLFGNAAACVYLCTQT